jgi:hypothetical protein
MVYKKSIMQNKLLKDLKLTVYKRGLIAGFGLGVLFTITVYIIIKIIL